MHTQSFHFQTPLFQGFSPCQVLAPLNLPSSPKGEPWVSSSTEVPVYAENKIENQILVIPNSLAIACTTHVFTGNNVQKRAQLHGIIQHLITNNQYECLLELIQKLLGDQAFGTYLNDFYAGNQNANFPTFFVHTRNRLELSELYIYGSGRLGNLEQNLVLHAGAEQQVVWNPFVEDPSHLADSLLDEHESIASTPDVYTTSATHKSFIIGQKRYEISNHLGNVSSVITDRKFGVPLSSTDPTISYYLADIVSATDYDPYGQALPGRVWNRTGYRFGFNGKETDPEWEIQDYGFRLYDPSIGRFLTIDPLSNKFPMLTPFQFASCNPIQNIDLDGLEGEPATEKKENTTPDESKAPFKDAENTRVSPWADKETAELIRRGPDKITTKPVEYPKNESDIKQLNLPNTRFKHKPEFYTGYNENTYRDTDGIEHGNCYGAACGYLVKAGFKLKNASGNYIGKKPAFGLVFNPEEVINLYDQKRPYEVTMRNTTPDRKTNIWDVVNFELDKGNPVMLGVHVQGGDSQNNQDKFTTHYVIAVDTGIDKDGKFILFVENGSDYPIPDQSSDLKFRIKQDGSVQIIKSSWTQSPMVVTSIFFAEPNKKK